MTAAIKQHLIDPAVCIRCNTCEATCPVDAVTHDDNNYVVDASKCNFCMDCVSPCPTGSINHFVQVAKAYSLEDQFSWTELPPEDAVAGNGSPSASIEAVDEDAAALLADAHKGAGGKVRRRASTKKARIKL
jgi:benzoyl-CoA 2,3-dioxygenase component A